MVPVLPVNACDVKSSPAVCVAVDAASWPLNLDGRKAQVVPQDDGGRILMVAQPNGYVLAVQVPVNLKISDADG